MSKLSAIPILCPKELIVVNLYPFTLSLSLLYPKFIISWLLKNADWNFVVSPCISFGIEEFPKETKLKGILLYSPLILQGKFPR